MIPWAGAKMLVVASALAVALALALVGLVVEARRLRRARAELQRLRSYHEERMRRPSVLSHELRTPLTVVRGSAELLLEESMGTLTKDQRTFVSTIAENANQVIGMASDLLAEARLESELFTLRLERVEMRQLVRGCVVDLRRVHSSEIRMDNHGAPIWMQVDPRLMREAITNLINNAARHAGEGVTILVSLLDSEEALTLAVSDDGAGMTAEERAKLFVPFATGGSRRPGTGLGMMITQRISEIHGGRVLVDTISKRGTTIYLTLPRTPRASSSDGVSEEGRPRKSRRRTR